MSEHIHSQKDTQLLEKFFRLVSERRSPSELSEQLAPADEAIVNLVATWNGDLPHSGYQLRLPESARQTIFGKGPITLDEISVNQYENPSYPGLHLRVESRDGDINMTNSIHADIHGERSCLALLTGEPIRYGAGKVISRAKDIHLLEDVHSGGKFFTASLEPNHGEDEVRLNAIDKTSKIKVYIADSDNLVVQIFLANQERFLSQGDRYVIEDFAIPGHTNTQHIRFPVDLWKEVKASIEADRAHSPTIRDADNLVLKLYPTNGVKPELSDSYVVSIQLEIKFRNVA